MNTVVSNQIRYYLRSQKNSAQSDSNVNSKGKAAENSHGSQSPRENAISSDQSAIQLYAKIVPTAGSLSPDQIQELEHQNISRASLLEELKLLEELTSIMKLGELKFMLDPELEKPHVHFYSPDHRLRFFGIDRDALQRGLIRFFVQDERSQLSERSRPIQDFLPKYEEMEIIKSDPSLLLGHVNYHLDNMGSSEWQALVSSYPIHQYPNFYPSKQEIKKVTDKLFFFEGKLARAQELDRIIKDAEMQLKINLDTAHSHLNQKLERFTSEEKEVLKQNFELDKKNYVAAEEEKLNVFRLERESCEIKSLSKISQTDSKVIGHLIYQFFVRNQGIRFFTSFQSDVQQKITEIMPQESLQLLDQLFMNIGIIMSSLNQISDLNQEG